MKLTPIIKQLQAETTCFKQIAGTLSDEVLENFVRQKELPAAYVVMLDIDAEFAEVSNYGNSYEQELTEHFGVVIFAASDRRGQSVGDLLDDYRAEIFKAIVGWCPDDCHDPIEFEGGSVQKMTGDRLIYLFEFKTTCTITKEDTWQQVAYDRLGEFEGMDIDVDMIRHDTQKPDGQVEAKLKIDFEKGA